MRGIALACALVLASPAIAKNPVSPAFDGNYIPRLSGVTALSGPDCPSITVSPLSITDGHLVSSARGGLLNGIVTTDGFVTGYYVKADKSQVTFEGRFVEGSFSGGIIDGACAYTVTFEKQ